MAIGTSVALSTDSPTDVDTNTETFNLRAADVGSSEYSVPSLTLPTERVLRIKHTTDANGTRRHLVQFAATGADSHGVPGTAIINFSISRPALDYFSEANMKAFIYELIDFLIEGGAGANVVKILNQEV